MKSSTRSSVARVGITPVAAFTAFSFLSTAYAGPSWDKDHLEDAGQTAATAQVITSSLSPIIVVSGRLTGSGLVQSDFVDMYQVQITGQTWVSISTAGGVLGGQFGLGEDREVARRLDAGRRTLPGGRCGDIRRASLMFCPGAGHEHP